MAVQSIEVNGGALAFLEEGSGQPVVLLNGLLGDYRGWRRPIDALKPKYRVLALSQRYFWPNEWPDDGAGFGVATHVADLAALLRKLDLPPVHLVGHSYGGAVAAQFAAVHQDLVRSLVLAEPAVPTVAMDHPDTPRLMGEFAESCKTVLRLLQNGSQAKAVEEQLLHSFSRESLDRIRDEHFDILLENAAVLGAAFRVRPPPPPFTAEQARRLTMPVLLIEGATSRPLFRITCEKLASCLPNVERATLPNTSHAMYLESPGPFCEAVQHFLARH
jgi:pimeloyl-ACP methyl ester carboxylesterase